MNTHTAASAIIAALQAVTKDWAKQRKAEERDAARAANRHYALLKRRQYSIKDAAYEAMEQAYLKASANGTLPATARQVMYATRNFIQQKTGKPLEDQYFTQTLLPDYMNEHDVEWDVVFDDRGHFKEPHAGTSFGLGTLNVREYLRRLREEPFFAQGGFVPGSVATAGPRCRFGGVLFIEKEGFFPLLEHVRIADRFDIAIMSTKGLSNTASRKLVDEMCGKYGVPLLVLHDFDKSGFSIVGTLQQSNRRYEFGYDPKVIDIGLRLEDTDGLQSEAAFNHGATDAVRANLSANGATDEEIEFLLKRRVELNAFTSDQLIAFIERKLSENRIKKVVPGAEVLAEAYRMFVQSSRVEMIVRAQLRRTSAEKVSVPKDLGKRVRGILRKSPETRWDHAVSNVAGLSFKAKSQGNVKKETAMSEKERAEPK